MSNPLDTAKFIATIPPLQSAIRTGGDGGRVTLEVPESEMGEYAKLIGMKGKLLSVTVEVLEQKKSTPKRIVELR